MISYLRGKIIYRTNTSIILDVQGVGYKVFLADKTLQKIQNASEAEIFCSLCVREGGTIELYGFLSAETLQLFTTLQSISGIGPKAALVLSSLGSTDQLKKAIEEKDVSFFAGVKGIGQKRIQKVILELTGKLETTFQKDMKETGDEALEGLLSLGFSSKDAKIALSRVPSAVVKPEERIKQALKFLGRKT